MKYLKLLSGTVFIYLLFFTSATQVVSCTKNVTDTLIIKDTITIKDTIKIKDTIRIIDSTCNCYDLSEGLVAYYNFNGGSLKDSSGKNNHINYNNATPTADRFGKANNAYLFNGTSNYMNVPNSTSLNPTTAITLVAIVKPNGFYMGTCHGNNVLGKSYGDYIDGYYGIRFSDHTDICSGLPLTDKEYFAGAYGNNQDGNAYAGRGPGLDTVFVKPGTWYHVVFTYVGGTAKLYINGVLRQTRQYSNGFTPNPYDLRIGNTLSSEYPYWFNGVIDEVRIYEKALCAGAVKALYDKKD